MTKLIECFIMHTPHPADPFCYQTLSDTYSTRVGNIITCCIVYSSKYFTAGSNEIKNAYQNISKACSELSGKYEGAEDFINPRLKELCSEHGIPEEKVRFAYIYFFMLRI